MRNKLLSMVLSFTIALGTMLLLYQPIAQAFVIETGNPDLKMSWENTIKYSTAYRLLSQDSKLIDSSYNPSNDNQDDGDRNFDKGFISNRIDLLSEFDAVYKGMGIRISGAGWYDSVYNTSNDNDSPLTANPLYVDHNEFAEGTERLHGRKAELLDAFAFGRFDTENTTTTFRVGQFAQYWGESFFFGNNGIAGGMAPMDIVKLLSVPNSQFKEIIRPIPQATAQLQIGSRFAMAAYYQFGWEESVLPGSGSYLSSSDIIGEGAERVVLGPDGSHFLRVGDMEADDDGQWGVQMNIRDLMGFDIGLHAIRYHDKTPQLYIIPGADELTHELLNPAVFDPAVGKMGEYLWAYPEDIEVYAISASRTYGIWNLATEVSMRRNMPLNSVSGTVIPMFHMNPDNKDNPAYAVGETWHANFSWIASFGPSFIAQEGTLMGEIAWNRLESIEKNPEALNPNAQREAYGIRMTYEPYYRQVLPGLDVSIPMGMAYFPKGKSAVVNSFGPDKGGDMSIGVNLEYLGVWICDLTYTHFYGETAGATDENLNMAMEQPLADRDFIAFSLSRTF